MFAITYIKGQRETIIPEIFETMGEADRQTKSGRYTTYPGARVVNLVSTDHMASNRPLRLDDLISNLRENLDIDRDEILGASEPQDELHGYVDSEIPVYNSDLAMMLADDSGLGFPDDPGCANEDEGIFGIIKWSIYERLIDNAQGWLEDAQAEAAELAEDDDDDDESAYERKAGALDRIAKDMAI